MRKNGEVFWARLTLSLVRDAQGQPAYLVAMVEDIDEQKRKSAVLAESEARFRAMFENAAIGMRLMSLDRVLLDANPAICAMSGYSVIELVGNTPALITYPDDYPSWPLSEFAELLAGETQLFTRSRSAMSAKTAQVFWMRQIIDEPGSRPRTGKCSTWWSWQRTLTSAKTQ